MLDELELFDLELLTLPELGLLLDELLLLVEPEFELDVVPLVSPEVLVPLLDVLPEDVEPELEPLSELELLTVPELGLLLDVLPDELFTVPDDGLLLDVLPDELLTVPDDGLLLDELLLDDDFLLELLELDLSDLLDLLELDLLELDLLELLELLELDFVAAFVSIYEKLKL